MSTKDQKTGQRITNLHKQIEQLKSDNASIIGACKKVITEVKKYNLLLPVPKGLALADALYNMKSLVNQTKDGAKWTQSN